MARIKEFDTFIDAASELLAAFPSTTTISITYSNVEKKKTSAGKVGKPRSPKAITHSISCKLYEPRSGKLVKFRTSRSKELSKILVFFGPKGINVTSNEVNEPETNVLKIGLASIMSNTEFIDVPNTEADVISKPGEAAAEEEPAAASSKKSKKKKKKKN